MSICFVIQPFDSGAFDKRYHDILRPAIAAAGLEAYRVDHDASSLIPIEDIEEGIRRAAICLADISIDNPNVWYELGYAVSARKPVVMICRADRERFPFDVQHRTIVRYKTDSASDFADLGHEVTRRLKAALETRLRIDSVEGLSPATAKAGLTEHELVGLITIAANSLDGDPVHTFTLRQEMGRAGYTDVACALAVRGLERKQHIARTSGYDGHQEYWGFVATDGGLDWLDAHQEHVKLKDSPELEDFGEFEDDLPF